MLVRKYFRYCVLTRSGQSKTLVTFTVLMIVN